ncbi:MAG: hypothetical protein M3077_05645 [Candidatus Dormibacteraeota bacterium]|nr:hypothetical protein [Candidatus Dormibacteraeota bacterium]
MTLREQLTSALQAAGLRLSPVEIDALLPAWTRYRALVDAFLTAVPPDGAPQ